MSASRAVYRGRNLVSRVSFPLLATHGHRSIARAHAGASLYSRSIQAACAMNARSGAGTGTGRRPATRAISL